MASRTEWAGSSATRTPNLSYRSRLPSNDQSDSTSSHSRRRVTSVDMVLSQHGLWPDAPSPPSSTASAGVSSDIRGFHSKASSTPTSSYSQPQQNGPDVGKKSKVKGMLNFLSVKEPSQAAFEEYAKSQRHQPIRKGGLAPTMRSVSVAPMKLPAGVPRVNSKWHGLPGSMADGSLLRSHDSSHSTASSSSKTSSLRSVTLKLDVSSQAHDAQSTEMPTASVNKAPTTMNMDSSSALLPDDQAPGSHPIALTTFADTLINTTASEKHLDEASLKSTPTIDAFVFDVEPLEVSFEPVPLSQHSSLPPISPSSVSLTNFSRPRLSTRSLPAQDSSPTSPSSLTHPSLIVSIPEAQEPAEDGPDPTDDSSSPPDSPTSSIAPSVMSASWYSSPRERLGLGGRLKMGDQFGSWDEVGGGKSKRHGMSLLR